ncbi:conserved repeat domain-containing protein [Sphingomonas guangdongensis]|uniref:Conserved repeat domain-containing protein n=1 Tax=Sphingomonas guangdongensis TaxID=1141890 RepID=A0A285QDA3_9SPHN|nr:hypothetical protein [Sphingomonas guangdongensis]SOB79464.1 conserved repeat domain-containing protein [Sphingomonas guangdongensis]
MFVKKTIAVLLAGTATLAADNAFAQSTGTAAGTSVDNTASVTYTVNGVNQSTTSNTASFVVDRKVNFTVVTDQTGFTQVTLGQQDAVTKFKVTNTTNGTQDFILDPDQNNIGVGILPGNDNFDVASLRAFVDSNNNGVYDANVDTQTFIDELAPDASVTVFVVGNVPSTQSAAIAWDSLHVIVAAGGTTGTRGSALIATDLNLANADNTVDIVFADNDSDGAAIGDIARNGEGRAYSGYEVGTRNVALSVNKSARVVADGVNLANFKAIPGATVEYCLTVTNATPLVAASSVVLTDVIPANTTYVPGSMAMGAPGTLGACVAAGSTEDDDADDGTESDGLTAAFDGGSKTVSARITTVPGLGSVATAFRVKIN